MLQRQRFIESLAKQIGLLQLYAQEFDNGNDDLALPMALSIRVLVHDAGRSTSILEHLGVKHQIKYTDTAEPIIPGNLLTSFGLVIAQMTVGQGGAYVPPLEMSRPSGSRPAAGFARWWKTPVTIDTLRNEFSRKDMILAAANKLGGAHVDSVVPDDIAHFTTPDSLGWRAVGPEGETQFNSPLPPSIRQIAYEVLDTIEKRVVPLVDGPKTPAT